MEIHELKNLDKHTLLILYLLNDLSEGGKLPVSLTVTQLSKLCHMSRNSVIKHMNSLKVLGYVEEVVNTGVGRTPTSYLLTVSKESDS